MLLKSVNKPGYGDVRYRAGCNHVTCHPRRPNRRRIFSRSSDESSSFSSPDPSTDYEWPLSPSLEHRPGQQRETMLYEVFLAY
jgi:hypothetical protein